MGKLDSPCVLNTDPKETMLDRIKVAVVNNENIIEAQNKNKFTNNIRNPLIPRELLCTMFGRNVPHYLPHPLISLLENLYHVLPLYDKTLCLQFIKSFFFLILLN